MNVDVWVNIFRALILLSASFMMSSVTGRTAFKTNRVMEVSFEISSYDWENITADPISSIGRDIIANVTYYGDYRENITVRLQGKSANEFCVQNNITKFSWEIETGPETRNNDPTIEGSQLIYVHNSYNDPSYMRQTLASYILDDASRTPRIAFINLTIILDKTIFLPQGLYVVEEQVDPHFIEHKYELSIGDLFHLRYPSGKFIYFGPTLPYPNLTLIDSPMYDEGLGYIRLVDKLRKVPLDKARVEEVADIHSIMFHIAASSIIGNYKGAAGVADDFFVHFVSYDIRQYGKAQIIPTLFQETFGIPTCDGALTTSEIIARDIINPQCPQTNRTELPLLSVLLDDEDYRKIYYDKLQLILDWLFNDYFISASIEYNRYIIENYINGTGNFYSYDDFLCSVEDPPSIDCSKQTIISIPEYFRQRSASVSRQLATYGYQKPPAVANSAASLTVTLFTFILFVIL